MFDWNDEELTNIIWDEAGESDDHIVPYPDHEIEGKAPNLFGDPTKKETNQENADAEQKKPCVKSEHGVELDGNSKYDHGPDSWPDGPDPSLSDAGKTDQDSMRTDNSNTLTKNSKNESSRDEMVQSDKGSEIFQNPPEDKEQGDFVDYGWANIGSFDDLDRIFSNNDPLFGNSDELWSSSKDVTSSPMGPTPLPGDSSEIKAQYSMLDDPSHSFISGYEKANEIRSHAPEDVQASIDTIEHSGGKSKLLMEEKSFEMGGKTKQIDDGAAGTLNELPDKSNKQKTMLKVKKLDKKSEIRHLQNLSGTWSSSGTPFQQVNSQYAPPTMVPPLQQNHFSGPFLASPMYGNVVNYHPAPPPPVLVNANPLKKAVNAAAVKPPVMTPKEKIEKLRRRQQMRALLAIQKQQQQFGNAEHSSAMEGGSAEIDENLSSFPSFEQNSPVDHDDSNNASCMAFDNYSVEESVLYRLQDAIDKLELRIRLCIRDSLFRLAQSAMQRQHPSDTSSTNTNTRDEVMGKDIDNHERFARTPDAETDTNPIDRTVAHLLFHRPMDYSGKPAEMPDSPLSANFPYEMKASSLKSLAKGFFPSSFENTQMISPQGSKTKKPGLFSEGDRSNSENISNNEAADGGLKKAEASN